MHLKIFSALRWRGAPYPSNKSKLAILAAVLLAIFIVFWTFADHTLNQVRINGPTYEQIVQGKDLIADILPPPGYLIESYLVVLRALHEKDPARIRQAALESQRLRSEFEDRHSYWAAHLPKGELRDLLLRDVSQTADAFLELRDRRFFPALLAGDAQGALRIAQGPLQEKYEAHRAAIDRVIPLARQQIRENEERAVAVLLRRRAMLYLLGFGSLVLGVMIFGLLFSFAAVSGLSSIISTQKRKLAEAETDLRSKQTLLQAVFDNIPVGIQIKDRENRILSVNQAFANRWRKNPEQWIGKFLHETSPFNELSAEEQAQVLKSDAEVMQSGNVLDYEVNRITLEGIRRLRRIKAPIRDTDNRITGILVLTEDVTEKVRNRQELEQNRNLLKAIFDNIPLGLIVKDLRGRHILVNRKTAEFNSSSPDHLVGILAHEISALDQIPSAERKIILSTDAEVRAGRTVETVMDRTLATGLRKFRVIKVPLRDDAGQVSMILGLAEDITERVQAQEELQRSKRLLQTVFDTIPHVVVVKDLDSRYLMVNKAWQETFGVESATVIGKLPGEIPGRPAAEAEWILESDRRHFAGNTETIETDRLLTVKDGQERAFRATGSLLRDGAGAVVGMVTVSVDVTEHRKAEERLRVTRSQLQDAIESMPAGFFLYDADERLVTWNSHVLRYSSGLEGTLRRGVSFEEMARQAAAFTKEAHGREEEWVQGRIEQFRSHSGNYIEQQLDDGQWLQVVDRRTSEGGTVSLRLDISELKRREQELRILHQKLELSHARMAEAIESFPGGFSLWDADGRLVLCNSKIKEFWPHLSDLLTPGRPFEEVVREGQRRRPGLEGEELAARTAELVADLRHSGVIERKFGERWMQLIRNEVAGGGTISVLLDITALKRREEELQKSQNEAQLAHQKERELESQLHQAQKMEVIGRLAAGVAHDFNNLLTPIMGYAEIGLAEVGPHHPLHLPLDVIKNAALRAGELTRDLLAFGRKQVLETRVVNLANEISSLMSMAQRTIGSDIQIHCRLADGLWPVKADPCQVHQLLMNLIVNARDAMPKGGTIIIELENEILDAEYASSHAGVQAGRYVALSVSDTGTGMDAKTLSHIFEPFFTTKESGKGTGLGLSIVYGMVQQHGGHIYVQSEPGHGTTFKIYLPQAAQGAVEPADGLSEIEAPRGGERVLVADDEPMVCGLVGRALKAQGYDVTEAAGPEPALRLGEQAAEKFAMLVTDLIMPKMDGFELYRKLAESNPGLKVLYISGHPQELAADLDQGEANLPLLRKPFAVKKLAQKVREVLDS